MSDLTLDQVLHAIRLSWEHPDLTFSYDVVNGWQIYVGDDIKATFDAEPCGGYRDDEPKTDRELAPCGTPAAHTRHRRRGEPIDDVCRVAENARKLEYARARRAREQAAKAAPMLVTPTGAPFLVQVDGTKPADEPAVSCRRDEAAS